MSKVLLAPLNGTFRLKLFGTQNTTISSQRNTKCSTGKSIVRERERNGNVFELYDEKPFIFDSMTCRMCHYVDEKGVLERNYCVSRNILMKNSPLFILLPGHYQ